MRRQALLSAFSLAISTLAFPTLVALAIIALSIEPALAQTNSNNASDRSDRVEETEFYGRNFGLSTDKAYSRKPFVSIPFDGSGAIRSMSFFEDFGKETGKNLSIPEDVAKEISANLPLKLELPEEYYKNIPWDLALDVIVDSMDDKIYYLENGPIIGFFVGPKPEFIRELESKPLVRKIFTPKQDDLQALAEKFDEVKSGRGTVRVIGNDIYVEDVKNAVRAMADIFQGYYPLVRKIFTPKQDDLQAVAEKFDEVKSERGTVRVIGNDIYVEDVENAVSEMADIFQGYHPEGSSGENADAAPQ
jgi:hypothetical protein